jgi:[protein-PII] uridylyltransferase
MAVGPTFRSSLLAARDRLAKGRAEIQAQHDAGSPGIQVCVRLTDLADAVVLDLYEAALHDLFPDGGEAIRSRIALVPQGGYGRRDMAPYSDVDLMILHAPGADEEVGLLAKRLMRDLFDAGLDVGHSVRTPEQALELTGTDAAICTSLIESRLLAGNAKLLSTLMQKFQRRLRKNFKRTFLMIEHARREERLQYGETVYLLEPNIKRSRGGLRDMQLLRWIGFARFGTADPNSLQLMGELPQDDRRTIRAAEEFLLRLRNEIHFHAGKSKDVLDRSEQVRIAELFGYRGTEGLLPVEEFMREYFRQTKAVWSVSSEFLASVRPGSRLGKVLDVVFSHHIGRDYRVGPSEITATSHGLAKLRVDLEEILRLMDLANVYNKRIAQSTWDTVRAAVSTGEGQVTPATARYFLSLLSQPGRLGELLRRLHDLGVLEKIIPGYGHARCLLQFNEYHKFTVDEHCLLAVERATDFLTDPGPIGRVYRQIRQKRTVHLALLIHDLGKGFVEDHSELGLKIAEETAEFLRLPLRETETLKFLVHKHLLMSHLAFRRDTSDDQLAVRFAVDVGSPERLDMLLVLTAADFAAVGPGVWNNWKSEVLTDLYQQTMRHLAGDSPRIDTGEQVEQRRSAIRACLSHEPEADLAWYDQQVDALPRTYLFASRPENLAAELKDLRTLRPGEVHARSRYLPESHTIQFVVGTNEEITPGVFHKLTGAVASQGLRILSAEINTLAGGLVLDRFYCVDPDHSDEPPADRLRTVEQALVKALQAPVEGPPAFRRLWRSESQISSESLNQLPTRISTDNSSSERYTILDIFARDRTGLLYTITRTLFELDLSVSVAKIGTYLDQVVDVFYVTDLAGQRISDETRLGEISARLLEAIDTLKE